MDFYPPAKIIAYARLEKKSMTKILKKSLACLLAFVLCFTAIASCLAVSAEAPALTSYFGLYAQRPSSNDKAVGGVCEGELLRAQLDVTGLTAGTTMGIAITMPEGVVREDITVAGWNRNTTCAINIVSDYLDEETNIFTMVVDVVSDGNYSFYVRFNITENVPKNSVMKMNCTVEAANTSAAGDENIYTYNSKDAGHERPMEVKAHAEVVDAAVDATCEGTGLTEGSHCSRCEKTLVAQEEVAALGHAWDEGVVDPDATCTEEGVITYTCANDPSHTYTEAISAKGHTPAADLVDNGDGTHSEVCDVCEAVLSTAAHEYVDGTCACGAVEEVECDHDWKVTAAAPALVEDGEGSITLVCAKCGETDTKTVGYNIYSSIFFMDAFVKSKVEIKYSTIAAYLPEGYDELVLVVETYDSTKSAYVSEYFYADEAYATEDGNLNWDIGVNAYQLSENMKVNLYVKDGENWFSGMQQELTFQQYAKALLDADKTDADMKKVLVDLLNFGSAVQTLNSYKVDGLANAGFESYQNLGSDTSVPVTAVSDVQIAQDMEKPVFHLGWELSAGARIEAVMSVYVPVDQIDKAVYVAEYLDAEGVTRKAAYVVSEAALATLDMEFDNVYMLEQDASVNVMYRAKFAEYATFEAEKPVNCTLYSDGEVCETLSFTIKGLAADTKAVFASSANHVAVFDALIRYCDAAKVAFGG